MSKKKRDRTYWCDSCQVPLLGTICGACGGQGRDLASATLVPVFRQEMNYLRKLLPSTLRPWLRELELWAAPASYTYYARGKAVFKLSAPSNEVIELADAARPQPPKRTRKNILARLQLANHPYIEQLQYEAETFIRETADRFSGRPVLVSFSGGKDSTVVSHLVMNALGRSDILHIFADTTIEFPDTYKYFQSFQKEHPLTPVVSCRSPLDFFKTAESIGPPSRILRWCCSTHKTNPLSKLIGGISPKQGVLTFDGIRRSESSRRSGYPKISDDHKIAREILARPIIEWSDLAVWIYILYHEIPFNIAYRKGFRRVGCLHCPFNSYWSINMMEKCYPRDFLRWRKFLIRQAEEMAHPNPVSFVENGWRSRAGGRGLDYYKTNIESSPCLLSDTAVSYQIISGDIRKVRYFLRPLGPQTHIRSNGHSETFLISDNKTREMLASIEIGFEDRAIRVNFILKKYARLFRQRLEKQLRKLQSCIYCGACGAKCSSKALNSSEDYFVDSERCVSCLACVSHKCPAVQSLHFNGKK